ncbi:hydroxyethylthiazole kinase [Halococcus hamelinensis]|uniref:Hydroxyethylthiazole kinase n=1 Tax=Halococcus hamelinensis 100A6 TaxID=1132509 RepID=M0LZK3_9EURY|nr:hydroxyethylthiazole kinase [Halococcus hamelinensis]EMA37809.1 hydroxyethylthiazole kinase [Halococcus hamelinensis 100A6]
MSALDERDLVDALAAVADTEPLVNALTNDVTVNDVANIALHWGGLPVMSDDEREVDEMVASADACLLNMGTVSERGESAMMAAGDAANDAGVPLVVDPVGVGATSTRDRVAERLTLDLDVSIVTGNYGEVSALAGADATVRGVESVGEYGEIVETAIGCARETESIVVASGEVDIVATEDVAFEVHSGDGMLGRVVGTGCMLGMTLAVFAAAMDDERAALSGTLAFGLAGEAAADGVFGEYAGPASYRTCFLDAVAGLRDVSLATPADRIESVVRDTQ